MDRNQTQSNEQGKGRTANTNTDQNTNSDISNVDRQEGEMNHGELGSDLEIRADGELDTDE